MDVIYYPFSNTDAGLAYIYKKSPPYIHVYRIWKAHYRPEVGLQILLGRGCHHKHIHANTECLLTTETPCKFVIIQLLVISGILYYGS